MTKEEALAEITKPLPSVGAAMFMSRDQWRAMVQRFWEAKKVLEHDETSR